MIINEIIKLLLIAICGSILILCIFSIILVIQESSFEKVEKWHDEQVEIPYRFLNRTKILSQSLNNLLSWILLNRKNDSVDIARLAAFYWIFGMSLAVIFQMNQDRATFAEIFSTSKNVFFRLEELSSLDFTNLVNQELIKSKILESVKELELSISRPYNPILLVLAAHIWLWSNIVTDFFSLKRTKYNIDKLLKSKKNDILYLLELFFFDTAFALFMMYLAIMGSNIAVVITDTQSLYSTLINSFPKILIPSTSLATFGISSLSFGIPVAILVATTTYLPTGIWILLVAYTSILEISESLVIFTFKLIKKQKEEKTTNIFILSITPIIITTIIALNSLL